MITPTELLAAILSVFLHSPARQCIIDHRAQIEHVFEMSRQAYPEMPIEFVGAVGFAETHLGCDHREGGNWGAPISPTRRHTAGTPMQAVGAIWHSYQMCGTWEGAVRRFNTGVCGPTPRGNNYARIITGVVRRVRARVDATRNLPVCSATSTRVFCSVGKQ